jgi:amidase
VSNRLNGAIRKPPPAEIAALAERDHLGVTIAEAEQLAPTIAAHLDAIDGLLDLPAVANTRPAWTQRTVTGRPPAGADPLNAFISLCDVQGSADGLLEGRTIGVKDNIDVAGVPTTDGSATLSFTPSTDSVVVERILAAGGRIVGKLNMDAFGSAATGEFSDFGPPRNPRDPTRSAGGSSGGSGAAVASGAVDLALAVDQAGSARIPASFCGVVTIKGTHGLVPTYGVTHIDHSLDFVCPMARTVGDAARLLEVVAGADWRDPQWTRGEATVDDYVAALEGDIAGLKVGIVPESAPVELCDGAVLASFQESLAAMTRLGAVVEEVPIRMWRHGRALAMGILCHLTAALIQAEGEGYGHPGLADTDRLHAFAVARRVEGQRLPSLVKIRMILGRYLHEEYLNLTYAKLHNLRLRLRQELDHALETYDVLVTPTTPTTAFPLATRGPVEPGGLADDRRYSVVWNTPQTNLSGHPALALPNGADDDGLPTSLQIIGRRWAESSTIRLAHCLERQAAK